MIAYGVKEKTCPVCVRLKEKEKHVSREATKKRVNCLQCGAVLLKKPEKVNNPNKPGSPEEETEISREASVPVEPWQALSSHADRV